MQSVIRKWGNSLALRLPASVLKQADMNLDQKVNIVVSRGRIIIEPSGKVEYDLSQLLDAMTAENAHAEMDFGKPVGKELL
jgi:antitoxin MazE